MKKLKLISNTGIFLSLLAVSSIGYTQEVCDSTCVRNQPYVRQPLQTRQSITPITYPGNEYKTTDEYQTETCPAGYRGSDGTAGSIYEKRTIISYVDGRQTIGEWEALQDNCVPIPPPPDPVINNPTIKTIYYAQQIHGTPNVSDFSIPITCSFTFVTPTTGYIDMVPPNFLNLCPSISPKALWFDKNFTFMNNDVKTFGTANYVIIIENNSVSLPRDLVSYNDFLRVNYFGINEYSYIPPVTTPSYSGKYSCYDFVRGAQNCTYMKLTVNANNTLTRYYYVGGPVSETVTINLNSSGYGEAVVTLPFNDCQKYTYQVSSTGITEGRYGCVTNNISNTYPRFYPWFN